MLRTYFFGPYLIIILTENRLNFSGSHFDNDSVWPKFVIRMQRHSAFSMQIFHHKETGLLVNFVGSSEIRAGDRTCRGNSRFY